MSCMVGICYRQPNQEEEVNKAFLKQLERTLQLQSLDLIEDFSNHDICWEGKIAWHKQSRRFLKCCSVLMQILHEQTKGRALPDLVPRKKGELVENVIVNGSWVQSR